MKILALALVLLSACASRNASIPERFLDCDAGQDISVVVAMNSPAVAQEGTTDHFTMLVEVGNNSHSDIEVKAIRVEPSENEYAHYVIERSYRKFDKLIAAGDDFAFELPIAGHGLVRGSNVMRGNDAIGVAVSVYLANGDAYRCSMNMPAPR